MSLPIKSVVSRDETNFMLNNKNDHSSSNTNWNESMPFVRSKLAGSIQEHQVDSGKHEYLASLSGWSVSHTKVALNHRNLIE